MKVKQNERNENIKEHNTHNAGDNFYYEHLNVEFYD